MGFNVSCVESVFVLILLDKDHVGCYGYLDNLEGAGNHCFEDCVSKDRGGGEHIDLFVVDIAMDGGSEGAKRASAYIICSNDVGCGLSAFGLGGYGDIDIESNDLGIMAYSKEAATWLVGWRIIPPYFSDCGEW